MYSSRILTPSAMLILVGVWLLTAQPLSGSKVSFTANPSVVSPCTSKTLTLRCSISDTVSISPSSGLVGRRDLSQTSFDTSLILSVIITKASDNNKTMASITTLTGGVAKAGDSHVKVQGDLSSQPGERAYLEMTWDNPTSSETGTFLCEVNAIDPVGHSLVYFSRRDITLNIPCPTELAKRIHDLEESNLNQQKILSDLKAKLDALEPHHSETGVIVCGDSNTWASNSQLTLVDYQTPFPGRQVTKTVKFAKPYESTPTVHVGMKTVGAYASQNYITYDVDVIKTDKDGFEISCTTFSDAKFFRFNVYWISTNS